MHAYLCSQLTAWRGTAAGGWRAAVWHSSACLAGGTTRGRLAGLRRQRERTTNALSPLFSVLIRCASRPRDWAALLAFSRGSHIHVQHDHASIYFSIFFTGAGGIIAPRLYLFWLPLPLLAATEAGRDAVTVRNAWALAGA